MRPFPGRLERKKHGYVLNEEQRRWLYEVYPTNTDKDIFAAMGISCLLVFRKMTKGIMLKKNINWYYYERSRKIGRQPRGCGMPTDVGPQKGTCSVATKISHRDYLTLCARAMANGQTKYQYLQTIIREALRKEQ